MIRSIRDALEPLRGLPLWDCTRAADMFMFQFGERHLKRSRINSTVEVEVGEYALHLQCPWRISSSKGIVTGSSDLYIPADSDIPIETFDWDKSRPLADQQLQQWFVERSVGPLIVADIAVDRCGGFVLWLPEEFAIEVFPDNSSAYHESCEQWRLFKPGQDSSHFVLMSNGIEK